MTGPDLETWGTRHQAARDACWRAWLALDPLPIGGPVMERIMATLATELRGPVDSLVDALGRDLDADARLDILAAVMTRTVRRIQSAAISAIADAAAMPEGLPFASPPAGAWVRVRFTGGRRRSGPTWHGMWHVFSGDWREADRRNHRVMGTASCGVSMTLRSEPLTMGGGHHETVIAETMPGVDACGRCRRLGRTAGVTVDSPADSNSAGWT